MSTNTEKLNGGQNYAVPDFADSETVRLRRALRRARERIRQLCGMVNNYSNQLGLGNKVHADDWDDVNN